jgi:hypothetical protein
VSITLPALLWEAVCDSLALEFRAEVLDAVRKPEVAVLKGLVKDAVAATVPDWKKQLENRPSVYTDSIPWCGDRCRGVPAGEEMTNLARRHEQRGREVTSPVLLTGQDNARLFFTKSAKALES